MPWVRIDDQFADHPKVVAAGPLAGWLHVCALTYCARYLTDGFVPAAIVPRLANFDGLATANELADRLLKAGLWEEVPDGFQVHDYLEYNPSREEVERLREERVEAGRIGGQRSVQSRRTLSAEAETSDKEANGEAEAEAQSRAITEANAQASAQAKPKQSSTPYPGPVPVPGPESPSAKADALAEARRKPPGLPEAPPGKPPNAGSGGQSRPATEEPRPDQAIYAALARVLGAAPATKTARGEWNAAIRQLREAEVAADDIADLVSRYQRRWPTMECTPSALAKHLHLFRPPSEPAQGPYPERDSPDEGDLEISEVEPLPPPRFCVVCGCGEMTHAAAAAAGKCVAKTPDAGNRKQQFATDEEMKKEHIIIRRWQYYPGARI